MSHPYAWAPETVRHLFRAARFGDGCSHEVVLRRLGPIAWAGACSAACARRKDNGKRANYFAIAHHLEVPIGAAPLEDDVATAFRGVVTNAARAPVGEHLVRRAVPGHLVDLALSLGVQTWGGGRHGDAGVVAVGFVLGLPVCLLAPYRSEPFTLAPS